MEETEKAYEITLCKRFLANDKVNPRDQNKKLIQGAGPYRGYVELCRKHNFDVSRFDREAHIQGADVYEKRQTLRPRRMNGNLLAEVLLTVDDFEIIKNLPYEQFLSEIIMITNANGGAIDRNYFQQREYTRPDIAIAIPFKYTSKKLGADYIGFNSPRGFTNGELLYQLAPFVTSNFDDFFYFQGLSAQSDGSYRLELNQYGW